MPRCRRVGPLLGLLINLILVVIKVIGGLASGSVALLADAGHSGADVANNVLVLGPCSIHAAQPMSHILMGTTPAKVLAAIASAFILMGAGLFFGWDSIQKLIVGTPQPSLLALWSPSGPC